MENIAMVGTLLVDKICEISAYPNVGELTKIGTVKKSVGGLVPNVGIDIKKLYSSINVYAVSKVGNDDDGNYVKNMLLENGVNCNNIVTVNNLQTSFTNVMSVVNGQRTFFTYLGTSSDFGYDDIDFDNLKVDILHLGYFLLLDKIDNGDGIKILKKAQEMGIKTSIDLVSENSDRYNLVVPCLKYVDYLIINEVEAQKISNMSLEKYSVKDVAQKLKEMGVKEKVIIHMPKLGVCLSNDGYTELPSYKLPQGYIKGTTGAGDAYCAGSLLGIMQGKSDKEILEIGTISATGSLSSFDAVSGMRSLEELKEICKDFIRN